MGYTFALVGNPNSGKTTMFNEITGSTQYVGNWPGVTVEKKEGRARKFKEEIKIVDLPGIYSLSPYTMEEIIARDYIIDQKPDLAINIVEATNIERNLYLTTQLMELGVPVVVALNMMDALDARGDKIDVSLLEKNMGIPVVPTSANKGRGVQELMEKALEMAQTAAANKTAAARKLYDDSIESCIDEVEALTKKHYISRDLNFRWIALKLLEGDEKVQEKFRAPVTLIQDIKQYQERLEKEFDDDLETIIADNRYKFITGMISAAVKKNTERKLTVSDKIDRVVTNRILAIPLFLGVMLLVFQITFGAIGSATIDFLDVFINETAAGAISGWLTAGGAAEWLHALIIDGILAGLGSILVFVPQIMILFLFLSLLEDSGYMARAAFVMDRLLRKLGLTGKSFIPMLMGFGCSVPAVMRQGLLKMKRTEG